MPVRDVVVLLLVFASLPFILREPYVGVLVWSWLAYMNPHKLSWGFAHGFPFSMIVALVTLAAMAISKQEKRIPWTRESVLLAIFTGWMLLTTVFALYPDLAWEQWNKVWKIMLFTYVTMILVNNKERIVWLLWIIVLSIGLYAVKGGIFTLTTGGSYAVYGPTGTFIGGNNEIGLAIIVVLPWMRYFQLISVKKWQKNALLFAIGTSTIAILGTQSRGALVGSLVMFTFLFAKNAKNIAFVMAAGLFLLLAVQFMPSTWHDRMGTIETYEQDASAQGRINAWWTAFYLAADKPLIGGGFEALQPPTFWMYAPNPSGVFDAHSVYFEVLAEHGFAGLTMFLLLGLFAIRSARAIMKQTKDREELQWMYHLGSTMQVSLVGYGVTGAFLGLAYFDLLYALLAILVVCTDMLRRGVAAEHSTHFIELFPFIRHVQPPGLYDQPGGADPGSRRAGK